MRLSFFVPEKLRRGMVDESSEPLPRGAQSIGATPQLRAMSLPAGFPTLLSLGVEVTLVYRHRCMTYSS